MVCTSSRVSSGRRKVAMTASATSISRLWSRLILLFISVIGVMLTSAQKTPNPEPVIWDINPKLGLTSGGTLLTIDGYNFGTDWTQMSILLKPSQTSAGVACPVSAGDYSNTRAYCTLPPGDGFPLFSMTVAGRVMRQLPRWYEDFYFWTWNENGSDNVNCVDTPNPNGLEPAHTWGDNHFCTEGTKASLLMMWSQTGAIAGQSCVHFTQDNETPDWTGMYACMHPLAATVYGQMQWTQTGATSGLGCVPVREGSDPNWDGGTNQICNQLNKPYNGGAFQLYQYNPPVLSTITPANGPTVGNIAVVIGGTGFGVSTTTPSVTIGGKQCAVTSSSHTTITCTLGSGQGRTNAVAVTVTGQSQIATINFRYDAPIVQQVQPLTAPTSGNVPITIKGINFGTTQGTAAVGSYYCPVLTWTDTSVTCTLPAGMGAALGAVLTTYDNAVSNADVTFSFDKPLISYVVPYNYTTNGGIPITLNGASFGPTGTTRVGGQLCVTITWSHTVVTCTLPAGAGAQSPLAVTAANQVNNAFYFIYLPPVITDVFPISAVSGTGVYLTLTGTSFGSSATGAVTVNGVACTSTAAQYVDIRILCALPSSSGWRIPVIVNVAAQISNSFNFTYTPVLTLITSSAGFPTAGNVPITLTGTSFAADPRLTSVTIGGVACPLLGTTTTVIRCTLPIGQGTTNAAAVTINGLPAPTLPLKYDAPTLTLVSPTTGRTSGGYDITLTGTNFGTVATVAVGLSNCPVSSSGRTQTQIICTVGAGSGQANPVVVTVSGQLSNSMGFNYNPPNITSITPANGAIDGGITVILLGTDFAGAGLVTIGTNVVSSTYVSSTNATFVLPAGSGIANVLIRIDSQSSNAVRFTYDGPSVTGVTPLTASTDATSVVMVLTGTSFASGAKVYVGGILCPAYSSGVQTTIRYDCLLPPGQGRNLAVVMKVSTQESPQSWLFSYNAPYISVPLTPTNGVTQGGNLVTITGTSFGLSGTATIGGVVCSQSVSGASWSHTKIICAPAAGQGVDYVVRVSVPDPNALPAQTTDVANSGALIRYYGYSSPTVTSIDPAAGPTIGGPEVLIKGTNFGTYATVTIGGRDCLPSFPQSHVQYACYLPMGLGLNVAVNVTVGPQTVISTYSYAAPTISTISPLNGPTDGGTTITVTGANLGEVAPVVTLGGITVAATITNIALQTQITFASPVGTGVNLAFTVTSAGRAAATSLKFKYDRPTISQVAGCVPAALKTMSCSVSAQPTLTITGTNFGIVQSSVTVTVDGLSCAVTSVTQIQVQCTLPANPVGGYNLPVIVTVNTQASVAANSVSYSGPQIASNSLINATAHGFARRLLAVSQVGNVTLSTSFGGNISFFAFQLSSPTIVRYGFPNPALAGNLAAQFASKPFVCVRPRIAALLTCDMQTGTGAGLVFQIQSGQQFSAEGVDTVNYPRPEIQAGTIRLGTPDAPGGIKVVGINSEGDVVIFDVLHIGGTESQSLLSVRYGAIGAVKDRVCAPVTTGFQDGVQYIQCSTSAGFGSNLQFEVTANGQTSLPGSDLYSYVQSPVIYSVSGCDDANNATFNCATPGGTKITIIGENFGYIGLVVRIGTQACIGVTFIDIYSLTCTVPAGTGSPAAVVVIYGQRFSRAANSLSYAKATATGLSGGVGCTDVTSTSTVNCPRAGMTVLTLTGSNFGPPSPAAIVVVGSQYCANVVHDATTPHNKLTCTLPTGTDVSAAVLLRQGQGVLSSTSVTVGYVQCAVGRYAASGVLQCSDCARGTYSDDIGQASCKPCDSGTYINVTAATVCSRCAQGAFSSLATGATVGATLCTNCSIGTYGVSDGASACSPCVGGYYADGEGRTTCVACATGKSMKQSTGQTYCSACDAGRYMDVTAAYKDFCDSCPSGRYASTTGLSTCDLCSVGTISTGGAAICTNCTAGHFIDVAGQAACQSCAPGRYAALTGFSSCVSCQPGEYIPVSTDENSRFRPDPCPIGTYSVGIDSTACTACPQGTNNPLTGQSTCGACNAGFYRDNTVAQPYISCFACSPGYYTAVANADRCLQCPIGKISRVNNATICDQCATGKVQPISGQSTCSVCDIGKSMPSIGQGACIACDAGKYTNTNGTTTCDPCPLGTYSVSGVTVCAKCDTGYYGGATGLATCTKCGGGYYADVMGLSACTRCGVGTYANNEGFAQCTNCTTGSFSSSPGQFVCLPCSSGSVSQSSGQSSCLSCAEGEYQPNSNTDMCLLCLPGTSGASDGQASCRVCNPGSFSANYSALECTPCPIGQYQPDERSTACVACPFGTYNAVTGQVACLPCPAGSYSDVLGLTVCASCDYGKYAEPPLNGGTINCTAAAAGKYVPTRGARQDINCPVGTYQPSAGESVCIQCSPGEYNPLPAQTECQPCQPGSANNAYGQASCPICDDGSKAPDSYMKRCDLCDIGYVAAKLLVGEFNAIEIGAQNCTSCQPGYIAAIAGKARCDACPIGLFSADIAGSNCTRCADGYYNDKEAQSQCQPCPIGQRSTGCTTNQAALGGCIVCINCEIGSYRNETAGVECTVCPSGTYQPLTGQANCTLCDAGKFGTGTGLTQCEECPYGQITSEGGMPTCSLCPKGTYSDRTGGSVCTNCTRGEYGDTEGAIGCKACPYGYITSEEGQTQCSQCPEGTFQDNTAQSVCKPCAMGQYGDALGAAGCKTCGQGEITDSVAQKVCRKCGAGEYNSDFGASTCTNCTAGRYSTEQGAFECIDCAAGSYSANNASQECVPCSKGTSQILTGASTCTNCTYGEYSSDTGQKKCKVCEVGKANDGVGAIECAICQAGSFQPQERSTACRTCPLGEYSGGGVSICEQCEPGRYNAYNGSTGCTNCASGYKQDKFGTSTCDACNAGEWSSSAPPPTVCEQCAPNFISLTPGSPMCSACDVLAEASITRTLCLCAIGYASIYKNNTNDQEADMTCIPCPDGAVCDQKGIVWLEMAAQVGWWKANQTFYRCLVKSHCTGGNNETDSMRCASHRIGPLCAQVADGYTESIGGSVKACGNQGSSTATFVVASIAIFAAVVVQLVVLLRSGRHLYDIAERDERLKVKIQSGMYVDGDEDEHDLGLDANRFGKEITIHGPPPPKPDFTFKLKIALGFAQIISNLDVALEIQWPSAFKSFMASLTPANIDFVQVSSIGCVVHTAFYEKLLVVIIMPPVVCGLLIVLYLLPGYAINWRDTTSRKMIRRKFWKLLFYVLFLVYPYCSSTVLRTFVCKRVEGVDYLLADFSKHCYDDDWYYWAKIAGAMIVVYPLGIPLFFLFMLLRYRTRLHEVGVRAELGFLYDAYSRDLWWWEMADMLHKLVITSAIAFIPLEWQLASAMIVVCVYAGMLYAFKPYVRKSDDRLHLVSLTEIIMLLMSGNVFNKNDYDALYDGLMSFILIALVILFFIFFVLQALQAIYKVIKDYRQRSKATRARAAGAAGDGDTIDNDQQPLSPPIGHGKGAQKQSDWVDEYKAGIDITASMDRNDLRRKVTATKRLTQDEEVVLARNPAWAGNHGEMNPMHSSATSGGNSPNGSGTAASAHASSSNGNSGSSSSSSTIQL